MTNPHISQERAIELAQTLFGLTATSADRLAGYDDANYLLQLTDSRKAVLKVVNGTDSAAEGLSEAQSAVLQLLAEHGLPVPSPFPVVPASHSGSGAICSVAYIPSHVGGVQHAVRMLSFLSGTLLKDSEQSLELYQQLGAFMARVDAVLAGFDHPALHRDSFAWRLDNLPATYAATRPALAEGGMPGLDLPLLDQVVAHFEAEYGRLAGGARRQAIHSDANESNVLVAVHPAAAQGPAHPQGPPRIAGLLDFGDCCVQLLANEPAITAAYCTLEWLRLGRPEPLAAVGAVLRGYCAVTPLRGCERSLLRALMMGRLAQSLSLGAKAALEQPGNAGYVLRTQEKGWQLLHLLWTTSDANFLAAVGLDG